MLLLIESKKEIAKAQHDLEEAIHHGFKHRVNKNIGYPGGTVINARVQTDGTYWFRSSDFNEEGTITPRRLNWFGLLTNGSSLDISVEINTVYEGRNNKIAGFFACDSETGSVYLMHSGRVGGGTTGVGKEAFLAWSNEEPLEVIDSSGGVKEGFLVMPVKGMAATRPAVNYIKAINSFKKAVRDGELNSIEFQNKIKEYADYYAESSGRRQGQRSGEIDYLSRHGEVVAAIKDWRSLNSLPDKGRIVKNQYIDLGVAIGEELVEVFEIKTSSTRSNIYTAIGQLMTHGVSSACRRVLVIPDDKELDSDLRETLNRLSIEVKKFKVDEESTIII